MRHAHRLTALLGLLTLGALLAACDATPAPPRAEQFGGWKYPKINVQNDLQHDIAADNPIVTQDAITPMRITIPLRDLRQSDLDIQYHFTFLDKNGHQLQPDTGWIYVRLPSSTQVRITGAALDTAAVDWFVDLRKGR
jgi:uncharacterized protein YcfL